MVETESTGQVGQGDRFQQPASAKDITRALIKHVVGIAELSDASAIFVYVDALEEEALPLPEKLEPSVYYVTRNVWEDRVQRHRGTRFIRVPDVQLSRLGQVKVAIFLALSRGLIKAGDTVVFLAGLAATGTLDTLIVTQVGREYEIFSSSEGNVNLPKGIRAEVVEKTIDIATQLGAQGREGKPVGALFVIGDTERVASMTRQLVINPFQGYPRQKRNILDDNLTETIKEFSGIDGAFIISGDGIIESCGTYLKTASQEEFELPRGLGARHHSAAGITSVADCIAITVSESTGTVTVFRGGQIITEIERQRSIGVKAQQAKP
jgi:DNA integrity scanning protein DisA with diadenylate cyclase activity